MKNKKPNTIEDILKKLKWDYEVISIKEKGITIILNKDATRAIITNDNIPITSLSANQLVLHKHTARTFDTEEFLNKLENKLVSVYLSQPQVKAIKKILSIPTDEILIEISRNKMKIKATKKAYNYELVLMATTITEGSTTKCMFDRKFIAEMFNIIKEKDFVEIGFLTDYMLQLHVFQPKENKSYDCVVAGVYKHEQNT